MALGREAAEKTGKLTLRERSCLEFMESVEKARALAEDDALQLIQLAARDGSWQAAAWYLERTRQNSFGRTQRVEVDATVKTTKSPQDMSEEELAAFLAANGIDNEGA